MQSVSSGYTPLKSRRKIGGFTIVEIIIFLAISGVLFGAAVTFLSGSDAHNRFSQSMRDTQSKIQDYLNDIPTGFANGTGGTSGQSHCKSTGGFIHIDKDPANASPPQNTGDCIFLGKAIQFTDTTDPADSDQLAGQESQIYAYSVFGNRTITYRTEDTRPVVNLSEANPFAAANTGSGANGSGNADLTEEYTITGGAKVKRIVQSSGVAVDATHPGGDSHLAGFFLSFNQLVAANSGSASLTAYQYPIGGNHVPANLTSSSHYIDIDKCIRLDTNPLNGVDCRLFGNATAPPPMTNWQICFDNSSNNDTAILTISSVSGLNVATKLDFTPC